MTLRGGMVERTSDYGYDKVGNRVRMAVAKAGVTEVTTYRYDGNDRLQQESKTVGGGDPVLTTYTWDGNGNMKSKTQNGLTSFYSWDSDNRLISVKQGAAEQDAQLLVRYIYDARGNRVGKVEPGGAQQGDKVTSYIVDESFPFAQVVGQDVVQGGASEHTSYVWGSGLIQQTRAGHTDFYHADALGSTKVMTDGDGRVTSTYTYEGFGQLEHKSGDSSADYRFAGEYAEAVTGLQYNRERWYDSASGRFVSVDPYPASDPRPATLNRYVYVGDDPINWTDPSGLYSLGELNAAMNELGNMSRQAVINFGKGAANIGGRLLNQMGKTAERWVKQIVDQCLKPKKYLDKGIKGSKRQLDLVAQLESSVLHLETKSSIPQVGSRALRRLKKQLLAAQANGTKIVVVGADKVSNARAQAALAYLKRGGVKSGPADLEFINGLVTFAVWISEVYGEECLDL